MGQYSGMLGWTYFFFLFFLLIFLIEFFFHGAVVNDVLFHLDQLK